MSEIIPAFASLALIISGLPFVLKNSVVSKVTEKA